MEKDQDLEKYAKELQEQIMEQIKRRYSETVIAHWQNPRNFRKLDSPNGSAQVKGSCGDAMEMFLKMKDGVVKQCTFQTDGCGAPWQVICIRKEPLGKNTTGIPEHRKNDPSME